MLKFWALILVSLSAVAQEDLSVLAESDRDDQIIKRSHYQLSYNNEHEVANWVAYTLDHTKIKNCVSRKDDFRADPEILDGSAVLADYSGSGFDRGHLVPAGDMKFDRSAMSSTFFLSNMTPQPAKFNRGLWSSLENLMRAWAFKYKQVWIVTGPVLSEDLPVIGRQNQVSVPSEYFKVILRKESGKWKGIAFLIATSVPFPQLASYAVSIDTIEDMTGIDFFPTLNDSSEEEAESQENESAWDMKAKFNYLPCAL